MSIIAAHAASEHPTAPLTQLPPAWAAAQLGNVHVGAERVVEASAPDGSDPGRVYTSIEQVDGQAPAIRLQGATDQPLTLAQAWQQAAILQDLVLTALGGAR